MKSALLLAKPLHATVQGWCEKAGRQDAAEHGCGKEPWRRGPAPGVGGVCGGVNSPNPSVTHSQWGLYSIETTATFHTDEICLLHQQGQQAGQSETADTHATPLLVGGEGAKSDLNEENKAEWLFCSFRGSPKELRPVFF